MIVLHGGVFERDLFIWGEVPLDSDHSVTKKRRKRELTFLPYDAGFEKLSSAFREAGLGIKPDKKSFKKMILWLPTRNGSPCVSSEMVGETLESSIPEAFFPWKITALKLSQEEIIDLLCRSMGKRILAPGIILGRDLIFWTRVLQFSGSLIAKEQFIPTIGRDSKCFFSRWKPIFWGKDSIRLSVLAKAMPGVCRALSNQADLPPRIPPITILKDFITTMIDSIIRIGFKKGHFWRRKFPYESIDDQWLDKLLLSSPVLKGDQKELSKFLIQFKDWQRPLDISMRAPVRLCFRIEEPDGNRSIREENKIEEDKWYVRYLLQSIQDPSLLLSAEDIWKESYPSFIKKDFNLNEYLLLSLGQASRICPYVERSLRTANPVGYELDLRGAYEFLTQKARLFEQWGFGVMLPLWWTHRGTKLRFSARANVRAPKMRSIGGLSLDEIVQFDWEISLGKEILSYEEHLRDPFLIFKLRGLDKEELIEMLRAKEKKVKPDETESEALSLQEEEPLPIGREKFWNGETITDDFFGEVSIPEIHGALPKRLGSFPFWRGEENFLDKMEEIYSNSSPIGLNLFLGEVNWKVSNS